MEKQQKQQIFQQNRQIYAHLFPFRAVLPYNHKYETFAKSRWYNKPLLETLVKQFKAYDQSYYQSAIQQGRITMNGKKVSIDYLIKNGDKLSHSAIRQQPPILDLQIDIISDNDDYLVVNKPSSFTVHTGGGFHYNTLGSILQIQMGYSDLYVLHRLDRLTSGLIIYGKTRDKPVIFHRQNQNQQMKKMYYARVGGNFEWDQKILCAQIQCISHKDGIYKVTKQIEQQKNQQKIATYQDKLKSQQQKKQQNKQIQQIKQVENKDKPLQKAQIQIKLSNLKNNKNKQKQKQTNPDKKDSKTIFKKVFYDKINDSSLIQCYPISGRTHQIRVHLQFLGYPILNDIVYGGRFVGNNIIKLMKENKINKNIKNNKNKYINNQVNNIKSQSVNENKNQQLQQNYGSKKIKSQSNNQSNINKLQNNQQNDINQQQNDINQKQNHINQQQNEHKEQQSEQINKLRQKINKQWDINTKPWEICLHSYQYKLQGKIYTTPKPYWTDPQFKFQI